MKSDWLDEAVRAARDVGGAQPDETARTREKVMRSLGTSRRSRAWRTPWIGLAAAVLLTGSAWATGASPTRLMAWLAPPNRPVEKSANFGSPTLEAKDSGPEAHAVATPAATSDQIDDFPPPVAPPPLSVRRPATVIRRAPLPASPASPTVDALYAQAHALHFRSKDPARALEAWDRYLAVAPSDEHAGLVLEARYNRAICLTRLGRWDEARAALRPFAEGARGEYRREDARALLEEMDGLQKRGLDATP